MKKETGDKLQTINDGISAGANIISLAVPAFVGVPLICFGINRIIGYVSNEDIIMRLKKIEKQLIKKKISHEDFKKRFQAYQNIKDIFQHLH